MAKESDAKVLAVRCKATVREILACTSSLSVPAFCFLLLAFSSIEWGCARLKVKREIQTDDQTVCVAGATAERRSYVPAALSLPLQELSRIKLTSAVSQHLCGNQDYLFVSTLDGRLTMVDLNLMKIAKRKKLPRGHAGTIAVASQKLLIAMRFGTETLICHDLVSGRTLWEIDAGDIASEPLVTDSLVYVSALYKHIDAYRLQDGTRRWQFRTEAQLHASPALSQGILVAASDDGKVFGLEARNGRKLWEFDCAAPVLATPAIHQGRVFIGTAGPNFPFQRTSNDGAGETLFALNLHDGALLWKNQIGAQVRHAPAVNDSLVMVGSGDGKVRAFTTKDGSPRWIFRAGSVIGTSPLIAGEMVFVGSLDNNLYGLDARSGAVRWQRELEGRVRTDPIIVGERLIVASEERFVYVFGKAAADATN